MGLRRLLPGLRGRAAARDEQRWVGAAPTPAPVTAVVVHRGQPAACARTVAALRAATERPVRVVVVDNGSPPSSVALLRAGLGVDAEVVATGENLGFGPGANVGLRRFLRGDPAGWGRWVAVCPHDAQPEPGCIDRMLAVAEARGPRAGLACAELGLDSVPVVDPYFGGMTAPAHRHGDWAPAGYPHGTLLLASRACLADIGLFDESYFAYCEEADLGLRATRAGWLVGQVWGARVTNTQLSDDLISEYLQVRNTLTLVHRWSGTYHLGVRLALEGLDVVRRRRAGEPWEHRARAVRDWLRGDRTGPPPADAPRR